MKHIVPRLIGMLALATAAPVSLAQVQTGTALSYTLSNPYGVSSFVVQQADPACSGTKYFSILGSNDAWGGSSGNNVANYFSIPNDETTGNALSFTAVINYSVLGQGCNSSDPTWSLIVDGGAPCTNCVTATTQSCNSFGFAVTRQQTLTINAPLLDVWGNGVNNGSNGIRELGLNAFTGSGNIQMQVRFKAVMVGRRFTSIIGSFTTPQAPSYILRDPPGDQSYTQLEVGQEYCYGETFQTSNANGSSAYEKVSVGSEFSIFGVNFSWDVTAGISASQEVTNSVAKEYKTCLSPNSTYTTAQSGGPSSDLFIGSAITYNYGAGKSVIRNGCSAIQLEADLIIAPTSSSNGFALTEDDIVTNRIPQVQALVNSLPPGTQAYKEAVNQLAVWQDMIAMNNTLKANAISAGSPGGFSFNGGGSQSSFDQSITTSSQVSMDMRVVLAQGLEASVSADVGGNGVEVGGEITLRHEVGVGSAASNQTTTTHTISFGDDDATDSFNTTIYKDRAFGAPVFGALTVSSRTSCPYEGGYQLDQPQLWVGSIGNSTMDLSNVVLGGDAIFPIYACNESNMPRTYELSLNAQSNPLGAIISGFNGLTSSSSVSLAVPAGECLPVGYLYLSQPNASVIDFTGLQILLSSACENPDPIASSVTISAHFNGQVGVPEIASPLVNIYPVPANDLLNITLDGSAKWTLEVLDLSGRVIDRLLATGPTAVIGLAGLANGEYVLRASSEGRVGTARFSVMHAN